MGLFSSRYSDKDVTYSSLMTLAQAINALQSTGEASDKQLKSHIQILFQMINELTEDSEVAGFSYNSTKQIIEMNTGLTDPESKKKFKHKLNSNARELLTNDFDILLEQFFVREQVFDLLFPIMGKRLGIKNLNTEKLTPGLITLMVTGFMLATVKQDTEKESRKDKSKRRENASEIASIFISYCMNI
jgi:hypothetical protein